MTQTTAHRIILVDDDAKLRAALAQTLRLADLDPHVFERAEDALAAVSPGFEGAVVCDVRMPRMDGLELHRQVAAIDPELPVILITGHGDVDDAVGAMKRGAFDFITKPFATDRLILTIHRALAFRTLVMENRRLCAAANAPDPDIPITGDASAIVALRAKVRQVASTDANVLLEGESGVGKEHIARVLHHLSVREGRFSVVECGFLPDAQIAEDLFGETARGPGLKPRKGRVEAADGGTLFLHDIDKASPALQAVLARTLEERVIPLPDGSDVRPISFRAISVSCGDLGELMRTGGFRSDLFFSLAPIRITVPPLRARRSDIPLLFAGFQAEAARRLRRPVPPLTDAVRRQFIDHDWPGNMRELQHFAEQVVLGLPDAQADGCGDQDLNLAERVGRFEAEVIRDALIAAKGDVRSTLNALKIPRKTFYDKLTRHNINIDAYRTRGGED